MYFYTAEVLLEFARHLKWEKGSELVLESGIFGSRRNERLKTVEDIFPSNFFFFYCSSFSLKIPLDYLEKQNLKSEQSECSLNQWVVDSHEKALKKRKAPLPLFCPGIESLNPRGSKLILPPPFFFL